MLIREMSRLAAAEQNRPFPSIGPSVASDFITNERFTKGPPPIEAEKCGLPRAPRMIIPQEDRWTYRPPHMYRWAVGDKVVVDGMTFEIKYIAEDTVLMVPRRTLLIGG
jgi:hypothetical protein